MRHGLSELHKFLFEGLPVRGIIVRLTDAWTEILQRREGNTATGPWPPAVAEMATASQAEKRGVHGRRRSVSSATRKVATASAMPPAICDFHIGTLVIGTPGGYFTARWVSSNRPQ